jgi:hypothetical protein
MNTRHNDEASIVSSCSLPSLLNIKGDRLSFGLHDFSRTTPTHFGKKADLWGTSSLPPMSKYRSIFEDTPEEAEFKRQQSLHEEQEKAKAEGETKRSSDSRVRKNSLLGLGYNYHSQGDILKPDKRVKPRGLKPAKKISKHSTTIRKLKPDQKKKQTTNSTTTDEDQDPDHHQSHAKRRHSRIPGPLPRVLQRAKIQRMLNKAQEHLHHLVTGGEKPILKKTISLKDAGRDVIAGIRSESLQSLSRTAGIKNKEKYFGEAAKAEFYRQYHVARKSVTLYLFPYFSDLCFFVTGISICTPRKIFPLRISLLAHVICEDSLKRISHRCHFSYEKKMFVCLSSLFLSLTSSLSSSSLLLEQNPRGIFLGHKGLGDAKMLPVIEVWGLFSVFATDEGFLLFHRSSKTCPLWKQSI